MTSIMTIVLCVACFIAGFLTNVFWLKQIAQTELIRETHEIEQLARNDYEEKYDYEPLLNIQSKQIKNSIHTNSNDLAAYENIVIKIEDHPPCNVPNTQQWNEDEVKNIERNSTEFYTQEIETEWALEQQEDLANFFADNEFLSEIHLYENECRATLCRISLLSTNNETLNKTFFTLSNQLYQLNDGLSGYFYAKTNEQSGLTEIYMSRSENSFY